MDNKTFNIAVFDAEFTAVSETYRGIQEMIQCALLVYKVKLDGEMYQISNQPICKIIKFVKPMYVPQLSDYIKELTGISQEKIDSAQPFASVMDLILKTIRELDVKKIVTWGPDRYTLRTNCIVTGYNKNDAEFVFDKICDISHYVSEEIFGYETAISQQRICKKVGIKKRGVSHDAKNDAENLYKLIKKLCERKDEKYLGVTKIFLA